MRTLLTGVFVFSILLSFSLQAQDNVQSREIFKLLSNTQLLQSGSGNTQNKFILLDFWATWCGPCIAALPDLEKLQEKYRDSLQVISVSDEQPEMVQRYLSKKNFKTTSFVCDTSKNLFRYFNVDGRPAYFLLNPDGAIIWTGQIEALDSLLTGLMRYNKPAPLFNPQPALIPLNNSANEPSPLFCLRYNISAPGTPFMGKRQYRENIQAYVKMQNNSFLEVISYFADLYPQNIISHRPDLDSLILDLFLDCSLANRTIASVRDQVMANLQQSLNFTAETLKEKVEGYMLSVQPALLEKYRDGSEGGGYIQWKEDSVHFWRVPVEVIGEKIGNRMNEHIKVKEGTDQSTYTLSVAIRQDMAGMAKELEKAGIFLLRRKITVKRIIIN